MEKREAFITEHEVIAIEWGDAVTIITVSGKVPIVGAGDVVKYIPFEHRELEALENWVKGNEKEK